MRVENITFSISQSDMDFVVDLLNQKEKLEKACESNPSCGRSKNFAIELAMF